MDRNALDWLFSTAPQTIAAFVGLIFAGVCFIIGKIDDRVEKDSTLLEIANEIKNQIYKGLNNLLWVTFIGIALDLLFLYLLLWIHFHISNKFFYLLFLLFLFDNL